MGGGGVETDSHKHIYYIYIILLNIDTLTVGDSLHNRKRHTQASKTDLSPSAMFGKVP